MQIDCSSANTLCIYIFVCMAWQCLSESSCMYTNILQFKTVKEIDISSLQFFQRSRNIYMYITASTKLKEQSKILFN